MPTAAAPGHLWVSWDDYHRAIEDLAYKVHQSGWAFDQVLCLARGGLRPGDVFSRLFNVPLAVLSTSSYREAGGTVRGELDISAHIASTAGPLAGNILLVDDLVDSGVTLQIVQAYLPMHFPLVKQVRSAVMWVKACSVVQPDYYVEHLAQSPWIHQPFERYDDLSPSELFGRR